jgi:hypothetical protein
MLLLKKFNDSVSDSYNNNNNKNNNNNDNLLFDIRFAENYVSPSFMYRISDIISWVTDLKNYVWNCRQLN